MALLKVLSGTRHGEALQLQGDDLLIGRLPECGVLFPDAEVSSRHARLQCRGSRWTLEDLDSTNGTRVNGVEIGRAVLDHGDQLAFGPVVALFQLAAPPLDELTLTEPTTADPPAPSMRELSRDAALRLQRLLDRTRRDAEALESWVADCALFVRALRLVDWTRLEPAQQHMLRELVDETDPEAVLRNMRASLASASDSIRLAGDAARALATVADESPLTVGAASAHARALADSESPPLTPTEGADDALLPIPPGVAIQLLRLLTSLTETLDRGLTLRADDDATGLRLRVDGAPAELRVLCAEALAGIDALVSESRGTVSVHSDSRGTAVEIWLPSS